MELRNDVHLKLLKREWALQKEAMDEINTSSLFKLREDGELFYSLFQGVDEKRGILILKFGARFSIPRKGDHLLGTIPIKDYLKTESWHGLTWGNFTGYIARMCELVPVWYDFKDPLHITIGFKGATLDFIDGIPKNMPIVLGPKEPPLDYLRNLIFVVQQSSLSNRVLEVLNLGKNSENWNPTTLKNGEKTVELIVSLTEQTSDIIIQGPPGTGKSSLMAKVCHRLLEKNKRVLVTSLTNKALIELAKKKGLATDLSDSRIFKSSLSLDEVKMAEGLLDMAYFKHEDSSMLLCTYFVMSKMAIETHVPNFDVVVVEEASQAFLATIAAARHLGKSCIVIGDQKQLRPVHAIQIEDMDFPEMAKLLYGLETVCNHSESDNKFFLNETYRLNPETTLATNSFYNDSLVGLGESVRIVYPRMEGIIRDKVVQSIYKRMPARDKAPLTGLGYIKKLIVELANLNPSLEIALLTPFVTTAKYCFKEIMPVLTAGHQVSIETIDRVQGATVDILVLFVPNHSLHFSFEPNRFNMATSRAQYATFLVLPDDINKDNLDPQVKLYLERVG